VKAEVIFISWASDCSRSDGIAMRLGGESHMVYSPFWGSHPATIVFKYLSQTIKTLWLLIRRRPRVVFVMVPPVVACAPVWMYCVLTGARFVIDAHSGAFDHPRWRRLQFMQRFFSRRAVTTIVTGDHFRKLVESWRADSTIVTDVPVVFASPAQVKLPDGPNLVLVSSFCDDEPTADFVRAAAQLPGVHFHVTGNTKHLAAQIRQLAPSNVRFTGFLSDAEYVGLLMAADGVMALTIRDHTMQRAAYEAVYLGKPVITSDFPILRDAFPLGALHIAPTQEGIREGVDEFLSSLPRLTSEVQEMRARKLSRWTEVDEELRGRLGLRESKRVEAPIPLDLAIEGVCRVEGS
jgi:glycosyltransferase involved in cell wall biosynthesis